LKSLQAQEQNLIHCNWSSRRKRHFISWGRLPVGLPLWEGPGNATRTPWERLGTLRERLGNAWERQLLSWYVLKKEQSSHRGYREHGDKTEESS